MTLILFGLLVGGYVLWEQQSRRGSLDAEYSSTRTDSLGTRALFLTLEALRMNPQRWTADYTRLPSPAMLFIVAPSKRGGMLASDRILPFEIKSLDDWVRRGNTVVIMSREPNRLFEALRVFTAVASGGGDSSPAQPGRLAAGVPRLTLESVRAFRFGAEPDPEGPFAMQGDGAPPPIAPPAEKQWLTLFGTRSDPLVIATTRGLGEYILVADPYPASNTGLAQTGNLRFMVNLASHAPGGRILFDEAHHREIQRGFVSYAKARSLSPFLLYLLVVAALAIWRGSVRFGEAVPLITGRHRDSAEYLRAVAALYRNAGMGRDGLASSYANFRRLAAGRFQLGTGWDPGRVANRLAERGPLNAGAVRELLAAVEAALSRPQLTEAEALPLVTRLATLERQLTRK